MDQLSFASLDYAAKKKRTKRDVFLAEMAAVVPWVALEALIEPHYPKAGPSGGRRAFPLAVMHGFIACSSGTTSLIPARKKFFTTSARCARSRVWNSDATLFPMRRPS